MAPSHIDDMQPVQGSVSTHFFLGSSTRGESLGFAGLTAGDLDALTYLNGVVHETLRLYPPGVISARRVMRDLSFDGHRIRAGRLLIFSPYVTHRLPELWPEPTEFRPLRWDSGAPGYRKPAPHEFLPFSGGLHRCIGAAMATTEMTVMLARLVARTRLRLPAQRIRARNLAALSPRPGAAHGPPRQPTTSAAGCSWRASWTCMCTWIRRTSST